MERFKPIIGGHSQINSFMKQKINELELEKVYLDPYSSKCVIHSFIYVRILQNLAHNQLSGYHQQIHKLTSDLANCEKILMVRQFQ